MDAAAASCTPPLSGLSTERPAGPCKMRTRCEIRLSCWSGSRSAWALPRMNALQGLLPLDRLGACHCPTGAGAAPAPPTVGGCAARSTNAPPGLLMVHAEPNPHCLRQHLGRRKWLVENCWSGPSSVWWVRRYWRCGYVDNDNIWLTAFTPGARMSSSSALTAQKHNLQGGSLLAASFPGVAAVLTDNRVDASHSDGCQRIQAQMCRR